jgi:hypothetical protein
MKTPLLSSDVAIGDDDDAGIEMVFLQGDFDDLSFTFNGALIYFQFFTDANERGNTACRFNVTNRSDFFDVTKLVGAGVIENGRLVVGQSFKAA